MRTPRIRQPTGSSVTEYVDWVEARMITRGRTRLSRSEFRRWLENTTQLDDEELDVQTDLVLQEVRRRARSVGPSYPFVLRGTRLEFDQERPAAPYVFLLCLSTSDRLRSEKRQGDVEVLLDLVVLEALCQYLGTGSTGVRFGWPPSDDRPTGFSDAIRWLSEHLALPPGTGRRRPHSKDNGVDVVVWKPFRDRREGFITILAQCTVAIDWVPKAKDITEDVWRGLIDFAKDPVICIAIPHVVPHRFEKWDELRRTVHFVLDRLRICELLAGDALQCEERVRQFVEAELAVMRG